MGYEIQAVIAKMSTLALLSQSSGYIRAVSLNQDFGLVPLIDEFLDDLQSARPDLRAQPDPFEGFCKLSAVVADLLKNVSNSGSLAYVEAEFFGGAGGQSSIAWANGSVSSGPHHTEDAINLALLHLGVQAIAPYDEFDSLGLGQKRHTKQWLSS